MQICPWFEGAEHRGVHRSVEIGVVEDENGALPPSSSSTGFRCSAQSFAICGRRATSR